ncbi:MAG: hypothetical protein WAK40_00015 [Thermoplasmata archaeon]
MASKSLPPSREGQLYALAQAVERHDVWVKALLKRVDELEMNREIARASCCVAHEQALLDIKRKLQAFKEATHGLPLGQEDVVKGASVFNWRVAHERELVDPLLAFVEGVLNSPLSLERDQAEKAVKGPTSG